MRPDIQYFYDKFGYFNRLCFSGKLKQPEIRLNTRRQTMGLTCCKTNIVTGELTIWIEISVRFDLPEIEYIDTLLHEMIHYYIMSNNITDDSPHGSVFKSEMRRITNDYGYRITIDYNPTVQELSKITSRLRYFCTIKLTDGKVYLSVVAKSNLFILWDKCLEVPGVVERNWYVSDRESLGKFPLGSNFHFFHIKEEDLSLYLNGARKLIKEGNRIRLSE